MTGLIKYLHKLVNQKNVQKRTSTPWMPNGKSFSKFIYIYIYKNNIYIYIYIIQNYIIYIYNLYIILCNT